MKVSIYDLNKNFVMLFWLSGKRCMNDCFLYDYTHMNHVLKDNVKQVDVTLLKM